MKILINALSGIGDVLMFTPALRLLREKLPDSRIDALVMYKSVYQLFKNNPFIDDVIFIDFFKQSKFKSLKEVHRLRNNKYDFGINTYPSNRFEYNVLNYLLGAKKRLGHSYNHSNFFRFEFLNNITIKEIQDRHNVLQNIDLIKTIVNIDDITEYPCMEIYIDKHYDEKTKKWISDINREGRVVIGFHPGSATLKNHINKRWGKHKYIELGKKLIEKDNAVILLFGNEFELNEDIKKGIGENAVISSTDDFNDSLSRMKECKLFVSNDTAFMHSAAALQIPVIAIFGYTNHKELYPWNVKYIVIRKKLDCSPCFYNSPKPASCKWKGEERFKCMKQISVDDVYFGCSKLL
ncbi:MAG: glycosyltransferase family 9 protein [Ignavibacteria bacterium]|nr:glycosyltransferase family 9 protein [Ignavibacteria bacterium]